MCSPQWSIAEWVEGLEPDSKASKGKRLLKALTSLETGILTKTHKSMKMISQTDKYQVSQKENLQKTQTFLKNKSRVLPKIHSDTTNTT
jgi:hypothetical protein